LPFGSLFLGNTISIVRLAIIYSPNPASCVSHSGHACVNSAMLSRSVGPSHMANAAQRSLSCTWFKKVDVLSLWK